MEVQNERHTPFKTRLDGHGYLLYTSCWGASSEYKNHEYLSIKTLHFFYTFVNRKLDEALSTLFNNLSLAHP